MGGDGEEPRPEERDQDIRGGTAFALAGLGGFNAHGAGFLAAASDCGVVPDLVTATSGQIVMLATWLEGHDLETAIVDPSLEANPAAQLSVALFGDPGVFRPAFPETLSRWWSWPRRGEQPVDALLDRLIPAQVYVPTRADAEFETMAAALNRGTRRAAGRPDGPPIGVVFNAYDVETGASVLFGNDRARALWPSEKAVLQATRPEGLRQPGPKPEEPGLRQITAKAVRSALWLSLYGFEGLPQPNLIDGAYDRSCIVAELHTFGRIYVARPLARGWPGHPPANQLEIQDWQTEMWFSVGYRAEVDALHTINGLVREGKLEAPFKEVAILEVVPRTPAGFGNYFIERKAVYRAAYERAREVFEGRRRENEA